MLVIDVNESETALYTKDTLKIVKKNCDLQCQLPLKNNKSAQS